MSWPAELSGRVAALEARLSVRVRHVPGLGEPWAWDGESRTVRVRDADTLARILPSLEPARPVGASGPAPGAAS